jgi:DNA-directed RNA polymerase II subunit RPB2
LRISYLQTTAYFRRFLTPSLDSSNNKITTIRNTDNYQIFFVCPNATPEGQKIGLVKELSLTANISLMLYSHIPIIKDILKDKLDNIQNVEPIKLKEYVKVLLNGVFCMYLFNNLKFITIAFDFWKILYWKVGGVGLKCTQRYLNVLKN